MGIVGVCVCVLVVCGVRVWTSSSSGENRKLN